MSTIAVIDYGMGNLHSIAKALEHVSGARIMITDDPELLRSADRLVFPGQGAIGQCMQKLKQRELDQLLLELMIQKPTLGICLGLQALLEFSEENGGTQGLGLIPGRVRRFSSQLTQGTPAMPIRIPHMGWNQVVPIRPHPLWQGIAPASRFYFVHSYYAPAELEETAATTDYGLRFACALGQGNLFAVQFHPEKSQHCGLRLLANFALWDGQD